MNEKLPCIQHPAQHPAVNCELHSPHTALAALMCFSLTSLSLCFTLKCVCAFLIQLRNVPFISTSRSWQPWKWKVTHTILRSRSYSSKNVQRKRRREWGNLIYSPSTLLNSLHSLFISSSSAIIWTYNFPIFSFPQTLRQRRVEYSVHKHHILHIFEHIECNSTHRDYEGGQPPPSSQASRVVASLTSNIKCARLRSRRLRSYVNQMNTTLFTI
jgi:hypothetical protein